MGTRLIAVLAAAEVAVDGAGVANRRGADPRAVGGGAERVAIWTACESADEVTGRGIVNAEHTSKKGRVDVVVDAVARPIAVWSACVHLGELRRGAVVVGVESELV